MIWDFRNLIRRSGGMWSRDWRESSRKPIRPPSDKKEEKSDDPGKKPDEHWLYPGWQPQPGSADAWKKSED
jgi:hypothetical protein